MGWMFIHKENASVLDTLKQELEFDENDRYCKILKKSGKYYALEVGNHSTGAHDILAAVILTQNAPSDHYNFGYKVIEESSGPSDRNCPESILKLLTEPFGMHAEEWRRDCWKNVDKHKRNAHKKLEIGDLFKLKHPVRTASGRELQYFYKVVPRKYIFCPAHYNDWVQEFKREHFAIRVPRRIASKDNIEIVEKYHQHPKVTQEIKDGEFGF